MTDPLKGLRAPSRALPTGGDLRAIAQGRRVIHRRKVAFGGVVGAGLLATGSVVAFQDAGDDGHDSIGVLSHRDVPQPTGSPTAGVRSGGPLTVVVGGRTVTAQPTPPSAGGGEPGPTTSSSPDPDQPAPDAPYIGSEPTGAEGMPIVTRTMSKHDPQYCSVEAQAEGHKVGDGSGDWCARLTAPTQLVAGHRVQLSYELCRRTAGSDFTLRFPTAEEVRFYAYGHLRPSQDGSKWSWNQGYAFPAAPHELTVPGGSCVTWTVTWSGQDSTGYAMEQGGVHLGAEPTVDESGEITSGWQQVHASTQVSWS